MKIRTHDMKQRAQFLQVQEQYNDMTGDLEILYQFVGWLWVNIQNVGHRYNVLEDNPMSNRGKKYHNTHRVFTRYNASIRAERHAIGYNNKIFIIKKIDNWQERNRILELLVHEVDQNVDYT